MMSGLVLEIILGLPPLDLVQDIRLAGLVFGDHLREEIVSAQDAFRQLGVGRMLHFGTQGDDCLLYTSDPAGGFVEKDDGRVVDNSDGECQLLLPPERQGTDEVIPILFQLELLQEGRCLSLIHI